MKSPVELYYLMTHGAITRAEFVKRLDEIEQHIIEQKKKVGSYWQRQRELLEAEEREAERAAEADEKLWEEDERRWKEQQRKAEEERLHRVEEERKRVAAERAHAQMQRVGGQWLIPLRPSRESMEREYERRLFG